MDDGCAKSAGKIGCGCLLLVAACVLCAVVAPRAGLGVFDLYTSATALDVSGECSAAAVEQHFEGDFLGALGGLETQSTGLGGDISDYDLSGMSSRRQELAAVVVPPCLEEVRAEELAMLDSAIADIEIMQATESDEAGPGLVDTIGMARHFFWLMIHGRRVIDAKAALEESTGAQIE